MACYGVKKTLYRWAKILEAKRPGREKTGGAKRPGRETTRNPCEQLYAFPYDEIYDSSRQIT